MDRVVNLLYGILRNTYVKRLATISSSIAVALSIALYFAQSYLIYPRQFPTGSRTIVPTPDDHGVESWEAVDLQTPDGETLKSFLLKSSPKLSRKLPFTFIFFHGNAGNIGHRIPIGQVFSDQMGANFLFVSYRGYGLSTGTPSEKGLNIDAQTALDWVLQNPELKDTKIIVYGQSLGGALGISLTSKNQDKIAGLVLENTFRDLRTLIPKVFPPAKHIAWLCHQRWPSETIIKTIDRVPILFLSGGSDELVPPDHMKKLYDVAGSSTKQFKVFPKGEHNDTCYEPDYFETIAEFIFGLEKKGQ